MRLSDAIRVGAMNKPQAFGCMEHAGHTCALGAAFDAVGLLFVSNRGDKARLMFPEMCSFVPGPCDCDIAGAVECVIVHLNDGHLWTREQIADWVATIEPQEATHEAVHQPVAVEA